MTAKYQWLNFNFVIIYFLVEGFYENYIREKFLHKETLW